MQDSEGKMIFIFGSKGGCGQSFIINCISSYFATKTNKNILLVDFNIGKIDSRIIFKVNDNNIRTIFDIENSETEIDENILKKIIVNFSDSLNVIFPPLYFDDLKTIKVKNLFKIFNKIKYFFDLILIDLPFYSSINYLDFEDFELKNNKNKNRNERKSNFNDFSDLISNFCDKLILISLPDLISISNLKTIISQFGESINYLNPEVIINKYNIRPAISFSVLNSVFKYPVEYFIPFDKDIEQLYLEKGPSSIFKYNVKITRDFTEICDHLIKELF